MKKRYMLWTVVVVFVLSIPVLYKGMKLFNANYLLHSAQERVGQTVPDLSGTDLDGNLYRLHDYIGKKNVVIVFWASWCRSCRKEIPHIKTLFEKKNGNEELLLLSSSIDTDIGTLKALIEKENIPYPVIIDKEGKGKESKFNAFFALTHLPSIWVIDKHGVVVAHNLLNIQEAFKVVRELRY